MKRREFLTANMLTLAAGGADAAESQSEGKVSTESPLSPAVQMQFMRPAQLEAAGRKFPVVYVPFGLIEWHGLHLPLGNDAIKAHGILVKCAEKFGGVVYPPVYFHNGFQPAKTSSKNQTLKPCQESQYQVITTFLRRWLIRSHLHQGRWGRRRRTLGPTSKKPLNILRKCH